MNTHLLEIYSRIEERYSEPVPIGGRCESFVYYRVEDLTEEDLLSSAEYVASRVKNVLAPSKLDVIMKLPGGYTFFAERLSAVYSEMYCKGAEIPVEQYGEARISNGLGEKYRGKNAILVTDVITTARSSIEAHTKATLRGVKIMAWATLIDRTFGPGPVSVVSAYTGEPVRLKTNVG